jgi:hypothetical protein
MGAPIHPVLLVFDVTVFVGIHSRVVGYRVDECEVKQPSEDGVLDCS